jgi:hypothetical protein
MQGSDFLWIGVAGAGLIGTYYVMKNGLLPSIFGMPKEGDCPFWDLTCTAEKLGRDSGSALADNMLKNTGIFTGANVLLTQQRANLEGSGAEVERVPYTPDGYRPSNWSWTLPDNTKLGIPAGITPGDFCRSSPGSPICDQLFPTKKYTSVTSQGTTPGYGDYIDPTMVV